MNRATKISITAIVLAFAAVISAKAADPWTTWSDGIKTAALNTAASKDVVAKQIRDVRCPQQSTSQARAACVAAYNVIIARLDAAIAEMNLKVAVVSLPSNQRDHVLQDVLRGYDSFVSETGWMGDQFDLMFPVPRRSSQN